MLPLDGSITLHRTGRHSTDLMARGQIVCRLAEKQKIVKEAYDIPFNIKTARLYKFQPNQIIKLKENLSGLIHGFNKRIRATESQKNLDRQDIYEIFFNSFIILETTKDPFRFQCFSMKLGGQRDELMF